MKNKKQLAFFDLLGLPEGLPFVLFCSLLGSLISNTTPYSSIALSFAANLAIYSFAQIYKHISNAPENVFSPSKADPNPVSDGHVSLRTAQIALFVALLIAVVSAFLSGSINIMLTFSAFLLTVVLFHPNIRVSTHQMLGFNQHQVIFGGLFLLNSVFTNHVRPAAIEILFPLLFVSSFSLLFRLEEVRVEISQSQSTPSGRFLLASTFLISAAITFILLKPVPFWTLALWVFLAAVQFSVNFSVHSETGLPEHLVMFKVFEVSGAASFLVYLIFVYINTYLR